MKYTVKHFNKGIPGRPPFLISTTSTPDKYEALEIAEDYLDLKEDNTVVEIEVKDEFEEGEDDF